MNKKLIIIFSLMCVIILLLFGILFFIINNKDVTTTSANRDVIENELENTNIVDSETSADGDNMILDNVKNENNVSQNTDANVAVTDSNTVSNNSNNITNSSSNTNNKNSNSNTNSSNTSNQNVETTNNTSKQNQTQNTSNTTQNTQTKNEVVNNQQKNETTESNIEAQKETGEKWVYNDAMAQTIVKVIKENPSQSMKDYGYSVVIDASIIKHTNQFTYTKQRVIDTLVFSSGVIKVYAQDYYRNNNLIWTEAFVL